MKKTLSLAFVLALLFAVASCSKSTDASELLSTVPSNAQLVVVGNVEKVVKDIDATKDGNSLQLSEQIRSLVHTPDGSDPFELLQKGGVKLSSVVMFMDEAQNGYVTGFIGDEEAFRSYVEKQSGEKFQKDGSMDVCGKVIIVDDRFWVMSGADASKVADFMKLSDDKSVASMEIADKLVSEENDLSGYASLSAMGAGAAQLGMAQGLMGASSMDAMAFQVRFEKGKLEMNGQFLDSKFQSIDDKGEGFHRIDLSTVKMLEGNAEYVVAVGIDKKVAAALSTALPMASSLQGIDALDGTMAMALNPTQMMGSGMPEMMMVARLSSAENAAKLGESVKGLLSTGVKVTIKGRSLLVRTSENMNGKLSVGNHLNDLEGAYIGVIAAPSALQKVLPGSNIPFDGASFVIKPVDAKLCFQLKVYTGSDANALMTLIKIAEALS